MKKEKEWDLIGAASSKEAIIQGINRYWLRNDCSLEAKEANTWNVLLGGKSPEGIYAFRVVKKGNRWRFEGKNNAQ